MLYWRLNERGIHALLPKPFAQSIEEAEAIFSAANERQVIAFGVFATSGFGRRQ